MEEELKRLRLTSCVDTIIEVHKSLEPDRLNPDLVKKFQLLQDSLEAILMNDVSEDDIRRVEQATNRLLEELGELHLGTSDYLSQLGPKH